MSRENDDVSARIRALYPALESLAGPAMDALLARVSDVTVPAGTRLFEADDVGSVREIVTRVLRSLADRGLVRLGRGSIEVLDPAGLRRVVEGA